MRPTPKRVLRFLHDQYRYIALTRNIVYLLQTGKNLFCYYCIRINKVFFIRRILTLKVVSQLSKPGFSPKVIIVPLGVAQESILEVIDKIDAKNKPNSCRVANAMPDLQDKMQLAIYKDRKYIWSYEGYEYLLGYFNSLIKT